MGLRRQQWFFSFLELTLAPTGFRCQPHLTCDALCCCLDKSFHPLTTGISVRAAETLAPTDDGFNGLTVILIDGDGKTDEVAYYGCQVWLTVLICSSELR